MLQHAYNQMGILWSTRRKPKEAKIYLENAEKLYLDFKADVGNSPECFEEIFSVNIESDEGIMVQKRSESFEHTYTHTLYYLAQVYARLDENTKSAEYCHVTLKRQLETKKYEPVDWALNAATLSQFYMTIGNYKLARHCLVSSERILKEKGEPVFVVSINEDDSQAEVDMKEKLPRCWADLYRCWVKYGLSLLESSMEKLISDLEEKRRTEDHNADKRETEQACENPESETSAGTSDEAAAEESKEREALFFDLELTSIEGQVSCELVKNFEEGREVFLNVQKWLGEAKQFYLLDGHCSDHVELVQDHSKAFKLLAFFEPDFERQCKMHKRRADMLLAVLNELSSQFYLMLCRQLIYEIAETFSAMLDLKLAIIEQNGSPPTAHAVKKINSLVQQSIGKYQEYIDTLKVGTEKKLPSKFTNDDERPALVAFFCMGRLFSKFLDFEPVHKVENLKKSRDCYKFLVDYCNINPSAKEMMSTEYDICDEMVTRMPVKMERIMQGH